LDVVGADYIKYIFKKVVSYSLVEENIYKISHGILSASYDKLWVS